MWRYWQEPFKVGYHPAKSVSHRHSDNWDIVVLVCHVVSQDHVIKGSCDFIGRSPSRYHVTTLPSLMAIGTLIVEIVFSLSRDFNVTTSPVPAWLASFESNPVTVSACQIWWNGDTHSYIKSYMDTLEMLRGFLKLEIQIYNFKVPETADRKRRSATQAITKSFTFQANAEIIYLS